MAKTDFSDGTTPITAAFADSIYLTDGGHKHDGGSEDGSAGKIDPETETDWGTFADAPSKGTDDVSLVEWVFTHAAGAFFRFAMRALRVQNLVPWSGDELNVMDTTGADWRDLKVRKLTADNELEVEAGDLTVTTGDVIATAGNIVAASGDVEGASVTTLDLIPQSGDEIHIENGAGSSRDLRCRDVDCTDIELGSRTVSDYLPWLVVHADADDTINVNLNSRVSSIVSASAGSYVVTLAASVADTNRPVLVTPESNTARFPTVTWTSTSVFTISFRNDAGGLQDPSHGFSLVLWNPA